MPPRKRPHHRPGAPQEPAETRRSAPGAAVSSRSPRLGPGLHYLAHTQPGLEGVAWSEIAARVPGARERGWRVIPGRNGMTIFSAADPGALGALRTTEDLFALVGYRSALSSGRAGLEQARAVARSAPHIAQALAARVRLRPGSRTGRRLGFRVLARVTGRHDFRRIDLQRAVERGMAERADHSWRLAGDESEVELWTTLLNDELLLALRLSDASMRHRDYKEGHRPASLRPAVAAAMAWLSAPADDDVVLDPMCGAGTLLIERAHLGRYRMLLGGDSDPQALAAARLNVGPRYKPIELRLWDAAAMPLEDSSVDKLITNLPWGMKSGSHGDNRRLYPRLMEEFNRVLRPGGTMVLLSAEGALMRELVANRRLSLSRVLTVTLLGAPAAVYVCLKPQGANVAALENSRTAPGSTRLIARSFVRGD